MNLHSQSIHFDPTGTPASRRLATLSIFSPSIRSTAFSMVLPSAGLMIVPPTSESFSARAPVARSSAASAVYGRTEDFTMDRLLDCGRLDKANNDSSRQLIGVSRLIF